MNRPLGWIDPGLFGRPHVGLRAPPADPLNPLPDNVLLDGLPEVYDQGSVGSCTAQALAAAVEVLAPRAGYAPERPDRVALYARERRAIGHLGDDSGAILADGIAALRRGWEPERQHPLAWGPAWELEAPPHAPEGPRLVSAEALDFDATTIAWELATGAPVAVGLRITAAWHDGPKTLPAPVGPAVGGHAVLLVGYSRQRGAWRVRNSWGSGWGEGGYAWLPWAWTRAPWLGEAHALRAIRRTA